MTALKCPTCNGSGEISAEAWSIGLSILTVRRAKGLTQEQLANAAGVSRPQIANIESGRSDMPTETLLRFAKALGVRPAELLP